MATEKVAKKEGFNFMRWYESYQGQRVIGIVYSAGAAVVILGALFKIQHYPGAGPMLNIGMGTEVLLFLIGILDRPHASFHWEEVFPQLVHPENVTEEEAEKIQSIPRPDLASMTGGMAAAPAVSQAKKAPAAAGSSAQSERDGPKAAIRRVSALSSGSTPPGQHSPHRESSLRNCSSLRRVAALWASSTAPSSAGRLSVIHAAASVSRPVFSACFAYCVSFLRQMRRCSVVVFMAAAGRNASVVSFLRFAGIVDGQPVFYADGGIKIVCPGGKTNKRKKRGVVTPGATTPQQ